MTGVEAKGDEIDRFAASGIGFPCALPHPYVLRHDRMAEYEYGEAQKCISHHTSNKNLRHRSISIFLSQDCFECPLLGTEAPPLWHVLSRTPWKGIRYGVGVVGRVPANPLRLAAWAVRV